MNTPPNIDNIQRKIARQRYTAFINIGSGDSLVQTVATGTATTLETVAYKVSNGVLEKLKGAYLLTGEAYRKAYFDSIAAKVAANKAAFATLQAATST